MAPFDAGNIVEFEAEMDARRVFEPVDAIVLPPIHPEGDERSRLWVHPNAVQVWEQNFKAA